MADPIKEALAANGKHREALAASYYKLCDLRDATYAKTKPVEEKLADACLKTQAAQQVEAKLAAEVEAIWGSDWLELKKEIASIARTLGKIPPRAV